MHLKPKKALAPAFPIIPATHSYRRGMLSPVARSAQAAFLTRRHPQHLENLHASPMQSRVAFLQSPVSRLHLHAPCSIPLVFVCPAWRETGIRKQRYGVPVRRSQTDLQSTLSLGTSRVRRLRFPLTITHLLASRFVLAS
jgi:hypothetical protein